MDNDYKDNPTPKLQEGNNVYIMQSGKKRKITNDAIKQKTDKFLKKKVLTDSQ